MPSFLSGNKNGNCNSESRPTGTVIVNGPRLQSLRQQAGLTQDQLASKSRYSDRLIRKAEASGPLRKSTIAVLAAALCTDQQTVTAADLIFSHEALAEELHDLLMNGSSGAATQESINSGRPKRTSRPPKDSSPLASLLSQSAHPELTLEVAGEDLEIPFGGSYEGVSPCCEFRDRLTEYLGSVHLMNEQTKCFASTDAVCIHSVTEIRPAFSIEPNQSTEYVWWFLKASFKANLLHKLELMYDTGNICRLLGRLSK
jgi:transcriptional regulator with XRE-family HTH domain